MSDFDVALSYRKEIFVDEIDIIDDFIQLVSFPGLRLILDEREKESFYAGIEWLLPTAVVFFICKSYFDGFLNEMGKDHYQLLKKGIKNLAKRLLGPTGPRLVRITSGKGKIPKDDYYSLAFSVIAEVGDKRNIKLLIQRDVSQEESDRIIDIFMDLLDNFHNNNADNALLDALQTSHGRTVLMAFNRKTKTIEKIMM